jgi:HAD superfamily hydrolase (TIGR01509 family)
MSDLTPTIGQASRVPESSDQTLAAVLWDFDGTLADTEPLWVEAEFALIEGLGASWSYEHAEYMVGNSLLDSGAYILRVIDRPDLTPEWIVAELVQRVVERLRGHPIAWRPGAIELLESLARAGIPCALVSASYRVILDAVLARLPAGTFQISVAGDEVSFGKPHPEPYETACAGLGVDARRCLVIEDSANGAASGNASGALVVGVPHYVGIPPAPRRVIVRSLTDLDADVLALLLEQANAAP